MTDSNLHRNFVLLTLGCMFLVTAAYLVFLYGSWNQFQNDRAQRDAKIDELLDRFPRKEAPPVPATKDKVVSNTDESD